MTPGLEQLRGASFRAEVVTLVLLIQYQKFADHVRTLGMRFENSLRSYLAHSDAIGRENWSQYGNAAKSIEICFLEFMSRKKGILGLFTMAETRSLAGIATYQRLRQGEILCRQGESADSLFILLSGIALIVINNNVAAYVSRGQEIGELGLIDQFCSTRTATIKAHYDCEVAVIGYESFLEFHGMLSLKQAEKVAKYVADCAMPKYFALEESKKQSPDEPALHRETSPTLRIGVRVTSSLLPSLPRTSLPCSQ
eukprot:768391-Hanusia_phi.AAC.7